MPDDRLRELFDQAAALSVEVPPVARVLARGQQRRRRARLQASTIAWTIMLAAGFGAPQVSGSLAADPGQHGRFAPMGAPAGSYQSATAGGRATTPAPASNGAASHVLRHSAASTPASPATGTYSAQAALPPPGSGKLILALDSAHRFVMTRTGSAGHAVLVSSLKAVAGAPAVLATNPAGGWVVALASRGPGRSVVQARLALVVASGHSVPFGPLFEAMTVTSAAVSQDGSRVAVAVSVPAGGARIEVLPLPGHQESSQSWSVPSTQANLVTGLSWSPDGRHLSYLAGQSTSAGGPDGLVTLDTALNAAQAPALIRWPPAMRTGLTCVPRAAAWLGTSGRYAVLSECAGTGVVELQTSDADTGAAVGPPLVVAHQLGCEPAALSSNASGGVILISYCGVYLDRSGRISRELAGLTSAALSG